MDSSEEDSCAVNLYTKKFPQAISMIKRSIDVLLVVHRIESSLLKFNRTVEILRLESWIPSLLTEH